MNTLNEQKLDYLNYMLGSITSSGSMTHIHTHTHTHRPGLSHAHTLCHNACILSISGKLMTAGHEVRDVPLCAHACVTLVHEPLSKHHTATVWLLCDADGAHRKFTTAAGLSEVTPDEGSICLVHEELPCI